MTFQELLQYFIFLHCLQKIIIQKLLRVKQKSTITWHTLL